MKDDVADQTLAFKEERRQVLEQYEEWLEVPMLALGLAWLVLIIVEIVWGLSSLLQAVSTLIWIIFIIDFALRFTLAPFKLSYLRANWLTAISLFVPALRLFRIARLARILSMARVTRGLRLLRIISSLNRGMRALSATMRRRGFGYVILLTVIVVLVGAAGMLAFEGEVESERGLHSYGDALWWTAMLLTTLGSDYFPVTPEGRVLAFILALYGFAVFGYVTATLATFFIGRDAQDQKGEIAGSASIEALRVEMALLREEIHLLREQKED